MPRGGVADLLPPPGVNGTVSSMTTTHLGPRAIALAVDAVHRAAIRARFIAAVDHANTQRVTPLDYREAVLIVGDTRQLVVPTAVYDADLDDVAARAGRVITVLRGDRLFGADR